MLNCYDRVALGGELLLFDHPAARPLAVAEEEGDGPAETPAPPTAEFAVEELQAALRNKGQQAQEVKHAWEWAYCCRFIAQLRLLPLLCSLCT